MKYNGIKLGDKVRDKVTGFTGVASARGHYLTGSVRFTVEARSKKGSTDPAMMAIDWQLLEVVQKKSVDPVEPKVPFDAGFKLGDKVRDKITGFEGVAVCVVHYINGCTHVTIEKQDTGGEIKDDLNTPWQRVELIEPDVFVLPEQSIEAVKKARGGPSTRMHRAPVPQR